MMTVETVERCDAADRNKQALYAMELDWGSGKFDYAKIRGILTGEDSHDG
jgi:hypothetical protein